MACGTRTTTIRDNNPNNNSTCTACNLTWLTIMACPWTTTGGNNSSNSNNISHNNNSVRNSLPTLELPWECKPQAPGSCAAPNQETIAEDQVDHELGQEFPNPVEVREVIEVSGHVYSLPRPVAIVRLLLLSLDRLPPKSLPGLPLRPDLIRRAGFRIRRLPAWFLLRPSDRRQRAQILNLAPGRRPPMRTKNGTLAKCVRSGSQPRGTSGSTESPIPENGRIFVTTVEKALCYLTCSKSIYENVRRTILEALVELLPEWPRRRETRTNRPLPSKVDMRGLQLALTGCTKPHRYLNSKAFWKAAAGCLTMATVAPCITKDTKALLPWEAWPECLRPLSWGPARAEACTNSTEWVTILRICLIQEEEVDPLAMVAQLPIRPPRLTVGQPTTFRLIF